MVCADLVAETERPDRTMDLVGLRSMVRYHGSPVEADKVPDFRRRNRTLTLISTGTPRSCSDRLRLG